LTGQRQLDGFYEPRLPFSASKRSILVAYTILKICNFWINHLSYRTITRSALDCPEKSEPETIFCKPDMFTSGFEFQPILAEPLMLEEKEERHSKGG
jgi:hypothetical protein